MASMSVFELFKNLFYIRIPIVIVYIFVCGFIILISPKRELRILGVWAILVATGNCLSNIRLLMEYLSAKKLISNEIFSKGGYIGFFNLVSLLSLSVYIARNILMWLYTKRNYGTKNAPIIAIICLIFCSMIPRYVISSHFNLRGQFKSFVIASTCSEFVFTLATVSIFLVIFFKNRTIERNIPKFWIFHLYSIISGIISLPLDVKANTDYNNDNFLLFYVIVCIIFSIITLGFYTYVAIRAHKRDTVQTWY